MDNKLPTDGYHFLGYHRRMRRAISAMKSPTGLADTGCQSAPALSSTIDSPAITIAMLEREVQSLRGQLQLTNAALIRAQREARIDPLTGLPNRRTMDEAFAREIAVCDRQRSPLSVAMLDLDKFKHVNDKHGHHCGDRVLKVFSLVMRSQLRPSDTLFRIGGEEFLLLLPGTTPEAAELVLERLQKTLQDHRMPGFPDPCYQIHFSAGLTTYHRAENQSDILRRCDAALYQAKRQGRNRICSDDHVPQCESA